MSLRILFSHVILLFDLFFSGLFKTLHVFFLIYKNFWYSYICTHAFTDYRNANLFLQTEIKNLNVVRKFYLIQLIENLIWEKIWYIAWFEKCKTLILHVGRHKIGFENEEKKSTMKEYHEIWGQVGKAYVTSSVVWWVVKLTTLLMSVQNEFSFYLEFTCTNIVWLISCRWFAFQLYP